MSGSGRRESDARGAIAGPRTPPHPVGAPRTGSRAWLCAAQPGEGAAARRAARGRRRRGQSKGRAGRGADLLGRGRGRRGLDATARRRGEGRRGGHGRSRPCSGNAALIHARVGAFRASCAGSGGSNRGTARRWQRVPRGGAVRTRGKQCAALSITLETGYYYLQHFPLPPAHSLQTQSTPSRCSNIVHAAVC